jgi:hypothetical protein
MICYGALDPDLTVEEKKRGESSQARVTAMSSGEVAVQVLSSGDASVVGGGYGDADGTQGMMTNSCV